MITDTLMENNPRWIIIHTSDVMTSILNNQLNSINKYHKWRGFPLSSLGYYVGYHVLITGGKLYKTKEDKEEGAHCNQSTDGLSLNFQSLGICIAGDGDVEYPTPQELTLLRNQVQEWQKKYNIPPERVVPHRYFTPWKTCCGTLLTDQWVRNLTVAKDSEQQEKIKLIEKQLSLIQQLLALLKK